MKKLLLTAVISGMTLSTSLALAADEAAAPAPPPSDGTEAAAPAEAPQQAAAPKEEEPADPGGRVRWGLSTGLGWHAPASMFTINGEGRIGYQISNMLSVYGAIGGTAGFGFGVDAGFQGATVSVSALSIGYFGAIAEAMFGDLFYAGGGFVLARGAYAGTSVGGSSDGVAQITAVSSAGFKPGLDIRFGLGFGKPSGPKKRRGGFNLGVDALILFHPSSVSVITRADGPNGTAGASVTETGVTIGFVPMLTLGYDSR
jgi:hypothetical protein